MVAPTSGWGNSPPGGAVLTVTSEGTMTMCNWKKQYRLPVPIRRDWSTPQTGRDLESRKELGCPALLDPSRGWHQQPSWPTAVFPLMAMLCSENMLCQFSFLLCSHPH